MMKLNAIILMVMACCFCFSCNESKKESSSEESQGFDYHVDRFADIEILRFKVDRWEELSLQQKTMLYYLSEAAACGRDIVYDQNCAYNLYIKDALENIIDSYSGR
jgi:dipeptidyl-peptidase-3